MRRSKTSNAAVSSRLVRLDIEDFELFERATLEFAAGFTACSGETGSGKTMLLGALGFALGDRSSAEIVRSGAARARVTLEVDADATLRERLRADGFDLDDDEPAILARDMSASGKSNARINGRLATAAQLRGIGDALVDRVGQHEGQRLLSSAYQLDVLDAFAGPEALALRASVRDAFERASALEAEIARCEGDAGRVLAELDYARFAAGEIARTAPVSGEDAALRERRDYLASVERIGAALGRAHEALAGESAAAEALGSASSALAAVARFSPALASLAASLAALQSDVTEASIEIARERESTDVDPAELERATARLDAIENLKRKYGGSIDAVLESQARFETSIAREATRDRTDAALRAENDEARRALAEHAAALGARRALAARALEAAAAAELATLAMPAARFDVILEPQESIGASGAERAVFALSPNPGEPVRALARAASGGELSRVLLALVAVLAGRREATALVFDEIDAGIGGVAAGAVGVRLGALARTAQVVCVTHLAQIASWADRHYALRKRERGGTTVVDLVPLEGAHDVREEIARMLSGSAAGVALDHADTLVSAARERKRAAAR